MNKIIFPKYIHIELTTDCNLRCPFCTYRKNELIGYMEKDLFENIIKQISQIQDRIYELGLFVIGEPLLHPDFIEYIGIMKKHIHKRMITFSTNGILLDEKKSISILKSGIFKRIFFSIDAIDEETYKKLRKGGDYFKVIKNIKYFLQLRKELNHSYPKVDLQFIITDTNKNEKLEFQDYWEIQLKKIGVEYCIGKTKKNCDRIVFLSLIEDKKEKQFNADSLLINSLDKEVFSSGYISNSSKERRPCAMLYDRASINFNGNVTPCCVGEKYGRFIIGNVKDDNILTIFNNDIINEYRASDLKGDYREMEICRYCFQPSKSFIDKCVFLSDEQIKEYEMLFLDTECPRYFSKGIEMFSKKNFEQAKLLFEKAYKRNPYLIDIKKYLAICYQILGDNESAANLFIDVYKSYSSDWVSLKGLGYSLLAMNKKDEAMDCFRKVLNMKIPDDVRKEIAELVNSEKKY